MMTHAHGRSSITIFVEIAAVTTGALAIVAFLENRKHKQLQVEIDELDKQLKTLQLSKQKLA